MTSPPEPAAPFRSVVLRALAYAAAATLLMLYASGQTTFIYMGF